MGIATKTTDLMEPPMKPDLEDRPHEAACGPEACRHLHQGYGIMTPWHPRLITVTGALFLRA